MDNFEVWQEVWVTGIIISEKYQPHVINLEAVVATVYPEDHPDHDYFKVWPKHDTDPQLPENHDGKLWFQRSQTKVVIKGRKELGIENN